MYRDTGTSKNTLALGVPIMSHLGIVSQRSKFTQLTFSTKS